MRTTTMTMLTILVLAATGCDKEEAVKEAVHRSEEGTSAAKTHTEHAPDGVKPGSHEDWCGEHAVPESMCTRCNASLTPAFKATGDWCEEHGLPESQCLECNPDLKIERPPKTAGR